MTRIQATNRCQRRPLASSRPPVSHSGNGRPITLASGVERPRLRRGSANVDCAPQYSPGWALKIAMPLISSSTTQAKLIQCVVMTSTEWRWYRNFFGAAVWAPLAGARSAALAAMSVFKAAPSTNGRQPGSGGWCSPTAQVHRVLHLIDRYRASERKGVAHLDGVIARSLRRVLDQRNGDGGQIV